MPAARVIRLEAPAELEDELVAELWWLGGAGSWSEAAPGRGRVRIHAFFDAEKLPAASLLRARLGRRAEVAVDEPRAVEERDWLAEWRRASGPIALGRGFLVDPREPSEAPVPFAAAGRRTLRLPARTAFGVGSHATTRLVVELLERRPLAGRRVLDVGTGSGVLALAALALGAREVVAFDVDPGAALLLSETRRLNAAHCAVFAGSLRALAPRAAHGRCFDLAAVNVVPSEIVPELGWLAAALRPGAAALFSGILLNQAARAGERLRAHGFRETERLTDGEWIAFGTELAP